jgi:hypothetical protein
LLFFKRNAEKWLEDSAPDVEGLPSRSVGFADPTACEVQGGEVGEGGGFGEEVEVL